VSDDESRALTVPKPPPLRGEVVFHQGEWLMFDRPGRDREPPEHPNCRSRVQSEQDLGQAMLGRWAEMTDAEIMKGFRR
jgi:hypothetical protein